MKYSELGLDNRLAAAIAALGYTETTPIQDQAFLPILTGKDVAGLAQTGTGKTAAFLIPLIQRILKSETEPEHEHAFKDWKAQNCILILVPTRELADQIHENVVKLTSGCGLKSYPFYGGTGYEKQKEALSSNLQFIVSTPGRLIDLYKEHFVDFKKVKAIVFDEADRMFDMGFKDDMKYILGRIERTRQFLVFSATLNFDVLNTAYQFGSEPIEINISKDVAKADHVKDAIFHIGNDEKPQHLLSLFKKEKPVQTIIFTNFKNNVDRVAQFLTDNQIPAMGISSLMSQSQRNHVISKFKEINNQNVLVATDVAARGLDISNVDLVINYELPQDCESYVHRIGRTGRAGKEGKAFSFVSEKDVDALYRIEEYTKKKIEVQFMEDTDLVKEFKNMGPGESRFAKSFDKGSDRHSKNNRNSGSFQKSAGGSGPKPHHKNGLKEDHQPRLKTDLPPNQRTNSKFDPKFDRKGKNQPVQRNLGSKSNQPHTKNNDLQMKATTHLASANGSGSGPRKFNPNYKPKPFTKPTGSNYKSTSSSRHRKSNDQTLMGTVKSFFKRIFG